MPCKKTITKDYNDKILRFAQRIAANKAFDTNQVVCSEDYLKAKRYKNLLQYLANDTCCPGRVKNDIIAKLQLNAKM